MARPTLAAAIFFVVGVPLSGQVREAPSFGLFIGAVEEGARMFTPVRLLPFDHPEAEGHEFPNALVLHRSEVDVLVALGRHADLLLEATLLRYPRAPVEEWPYEAFEPPSSTWLEGAVVVAPEEPPPLPGLRVALYVEGRPAAFIVDTRGLSLSERGMERPTTMGLDLSRAEFLERLRLVSRRRAPAGTAVVVFR